MVREEVKVEKVYKSKQIGFLIRVSFVSEVCSCRCNWKIHGIKERKCRETCTAAAETSTSNK
jgi:hypothetical protein